MYCSSIQYTRYFSSQKENKLLNLYTVIQYYNLLKISISLRSESTTFVTPGLAGMFAALNV